MSTSSRSTRGACGENPSTGIHKSIHPRGRAPTSVSPAPPRGAATPTAQDIHDQVPDGQDDLKDTRANVDLKMLYMVRDNVPS